MKTNKEYKLTTFGNGDEFIGKRLICCPVCCPDGWVVDDRGIRLIDIKDCPRCGYVFPLTDIINTDCP